jgi:hypothetical protein
VTTDAIFDDIISSLPDEVRARVDSASGIHPRQQRQTARQGDEAAEASHPEVPVDKLDELPEKLRLQVEKTIQEMDTRNTQRRMELKEHRRRRSE